MLKLLSLTALELPDTVRWENKISLSLLLKVKKSCLMASFDIDNHCQKLQICSRQGSQQSQAALKLNSWEGIFQVQGAALLQSVESRKNQQGQTAT